MVGLDGIQWHAKLHPKTINIGSAAIWLPCKFLAYFKFVHLSHTRILFKVSSYEVMHYKEMKFVANLVRQDEKILAQLCVLMYLVRDCLLCDILYLIEFANAL